MAQHPWCEVVSGRARERAPRANSLTHPLTEVRAIARQRPHTVDHESADRIRAALKKPVEYREKPRVIPTTPPAELPTWGIKPIAKHFKKRKD